MKVLAQMVIGSDGHHSIWSDLTAALLYCVRCHGVVHDLVDRVEAEAEAREMFQRGLAQGAELQQRTVAKTIEFCTSHPPIL